MSNKIITKRPRVPFQVPNQCLACDSEKGYYTITKTAPIEFRDEKLEVEYECLECAECGHAVLSPKQMEDRIRKTVAAYQRKHGLLTAAELVKRRKDLGLNSQKSFANIAPGVSVATLKRLEAGQRVQDESTDKAIRSALRELKNEVSRKELVEMLEAPFEEIIVTDSVSGTISNRCWSKSPFPMAACVAFSLTTVVAPKTNDEDYNHIHSEQLEQGGVLASC